MTSLFLEFADRSESEDLNNDNIESAPFDHASEEEGEENSTPPIASSSATSTTIRSQCNSKGPSNPFIMSDLIVLVSEMADAIKNSTHWTETVYAKVMDVDGFSKQELVQVLDYLQFRESEARDFIVRSMELRQDWIREFLSRMM